MPERNTDKSNVSLFNFNERQDIFLMEPIDMLQACQRNGEQYLVKLLHELWRTDRIAELYVVSGTIGELQGADYVRGMVCGYNMTGAVTELITEKEEKDKCIDFMVSALVTTEKSLTRQPINSSYATKDLVYFKSIAELIFMAAKVNSEHPEIYSQ